LVNRIEDVIGRRAVGEKITKQPVTSDPMVV
jgi:hypothetical protein